MAFPDDQIDSVKKFWTIFNDQFGKNGLKTAFAEALAGDKFDAEAIGAEIDLTVTSAPIVVYAWTVSLFSKKAFKVLDLVPDLDVNSMKVVNLDQPWETGNPIRAVLGRKFGRTSMPAVFIGGKFVGGYEDGPTADAPGLIPLAFSGKLIPMLRMAGAFGPVGGNVEVLDVRAAE
jgi:glutaredoxin